MVWIVKIGEQGSSPPCLCTGPSPIPTFGHRWWRTEWEDLGQQRPGVSPLNPKVRIGWIPLQAENHFSWDPLQPHSSPTKLCFLLSHSGAARTPLATMAKKAFLI